MIAWAAVIVAVVAVLGFVFAPAVYALWVVLLVFAMAAAPQAIFARRAHSSMVKRRDLCAWRVAVDDLGDPFAYCLLA